MKIIRVLIVLFLLKSKILGQTWEVVLVSGDTTRGLSFTSMQGEVLIATQEGSQLSNIETFDIKEIEKLRYYYNKKNRAPWTTRLAGVTGGSALGYGVGYMMGNIVLWWISYNDFGSLKLFGPRSENLNGGEKLIADIALKIVLLIGAAGGYDWQAEVVEEVKDYDDLGFSPEERKRTVQETIWPKSSNRIKKVVNQTIAILKQRMNNK